MNLYAGIPLLTALIPCFVGVYAWHKRGAPGALLFAVLMWNISLWGVIHTLGFMDRGPRGVLETYLDLADQASLLFLAPLWFVFALQYTGRGRWITRPRLALISAVPAVTLVLLLGGGRYDAVLSLRPLAGGGADAASLWFAFDLAYRVALLSLGTASLVLALVNSRRLYVLQGVCVLVGFLAPCAVILGHQIHPAGHDFNPYPLTASLLICGLSFYRALFRYRFLDLSPVAYDVLVNDMSDGMIVLDLQHRVVDLNPSAEKILGRKSREVLGEGFGKVIATRAKATPTAGARAGLLLERYEEHGEAREEITFGEGQDAHHYDVSLSALYDSRGRKTRHLVMLHEATERHLAIERLDRMARYDPLTGLPNRSYFYECLVHEIGRARRGRKLFTLLFLDLDHFKIINDALGHEVGDLLLKEAARKINEAVREYDFVARLAGDEFTVILPNVVGVENASVVADRIVESLSMPLNLDGHEILTSTSIGMCFFPDDGADPATLVKNADTAMYQAKAAGKNRYELYSRSAFMGYAKDSKLEADLLRAFDNNELTLHYQPEIQLSTGRLVGVEGLLRWEHPERGLLHPKDFILLAEETNVISLIQRSALREACRQMRSWQTQHLTDPPLTMSMDISAHHFRQPNLAGEISRILEDTGLPAESLILDFEESLLNEDPLSSALILQTLGKLGVKLAVDDFGAGSSSLMHLKRFPLDVLKIDSSFVSGTHNEKGKEMVSAIVTLARALNLRVVAQGVDKPRQIMSLKELECDAAQGSYFTEPLSSVQISAFLIEDLY